MNFLFSVVIPVYKAEAYIEDAIKSILSQSIGFLNNIQLILVNDGSPDDSGDICSFYASIYPKNIIYVEEQNMGVSYARNNGMKHATGKYITFLDADDKWEKDAFKKAYSFFCKNPDIDLLACMLEYFEGKSGTSHPLNWKFKKEKIVNIMKSPDEIQMHAASCFFRRKAVSHLSFQEGLKYAEDSFFVTCAIMQKKMYGVTPDIHYFYRKREDSSSAIDYSRYNPDYYIPSLSLFHYALLDKFIDKNSNIPLYIQHILMYDIQWRLKKQTPSGVIDAGDEKHYQDMLCGILLFIDDSVIMKQKNIYKEHKVLALSMKYKEDITRDLEQVDDTLYYHGAPVCKTEHAVQVKIAHLRMSGNIIIFEGLLNTPLHTDDYEIFIKDCHGCAHKLGTVEPFKAKEKVCVYGHYYYESRFQTYIYMNKYTKGKFSFWFSYKGAKPQELNIVFTETCRLNTSTDKGYLMQDDWVLKTQGKSIYAENVKMYPSFREIPFLLSLMKKGKWKESLYRILALLYSLLCHKKIWILSDRIDAAGDNGEYFFRYIKDKHPEIKAYFALSKDSKDYKRIKTYGKVVNTDSIWYKILFMNASKIISSQANDNTINVFGSNKKFFKDLYRFDFVFLQHGVIKDDLSKWLNCMDKDISIFVTSGEKEYHSVLYGNYGYQANVVKFTGLPRFDFHRNDKKEKIIAIMPTWRNYISGCLKNGNPVYCKSFKDSKFFQFYDSLMSNKILIDKMKEYGYKGVFCIHPMFKPQSRHFSGNDIFKISDMSYEDIFEKGSLLVTDYSSVFFDFAYMNKPVVYCQFDEKEFFEGHSYDKGYFDYEADGFGEVCRKEDDVVNTIIKYIESDCVMSQKYMQRRNDFFPSDNDESNCDRIFKEIKKINH